MKPSRPRVVADLLASALPDLGDRLFVERLRRAWRDVVGADAARRTRPQNFTNGVLTVTVDNSAWLHELTLRATELAAQLATRHGEVRSIRLVLGTVSPDAAAPSERTRRRRTLASHEVEEIDAVVAVIEDPALRDSARRLLTRARQSDDATDRQLTPMDRQGSNTVDGRDRQGSNTVDGSGRQGSTVGR
ncbi:MAG: DUF721 domain-containing protein [Candidatus Rokubacteria bacterium]|nr:DUF721 domain-containing protein [Candidatus Rokubacteria bacterium]